MKTLSCCLTLCLAVASPLSLHAWDLASPAEHLALLASGELLPPPELVETIEAELAAVHTAHPDMGSIGYFPAFTAGSIIIRLTPEAVADYEAGGLPELRQFFADYGLFETSDYAFVPDTLFANFQHPYNSPLLAELVEEIPGVVSAGANSYIGDGDYIIRLDDPDNQAVVYVFSKGGGDCPAGCTERDYFYFRVAEVQGHLIAQRLGDRAFNDFARPRYLLHQDTYLTFPAGSTAEIPLTLAPEASGSVRWTKNGQPYPFYSAPLVIKDFQAEDVGVYQALIRVIAPGHLQAHFWILSEPILVSTGEASLADRLTAPFRRHGGKTHFPYVYHPAMGWSYVAPDSPGGNWIYYEGLGWLYSTPAIYPCFYQAETGEWLHFEAYEAPARQWARLSSAEE